MNRQLPVAALVRVMESLAPCRLADQSWDNVGLLLECPPASFEDKISVMVTNDLTSRTLQEALEAKVAFIISYHPPWFRAEKRINLDSGLKLLSACASANISIYSPHTSLDAIKGGINDWLTSIFKAKSLNPIEPNQLDATVGMGRIIELDQPISLDDAMKLTAQHLNLGSLRVARAGRSLISSIAVCAGSGGSLLAKAKADLFITGEMTHHQVLQAVEAGCSVILTEHTNCERGYLRHVFTPLLAKHLQAEDARFSVFYSQTDADPLTSIFL